MMRRVVDVCFLACFTLLAAGLFALGVVSGLPLWLNLPLAVAIWLAWSLQYLSDTRDGAA